MAPATFSEPHQPQNNPIVSSIFFDVKIIARHTDNFKLGSRQGLDCNPPNYIISCDPDLPLLFLNLFTLSIYSGVFLEGFCISLPPKKTNFARLVQLSIH